MSGNARRRSSRSEARTPARHRLCLPELAVLGLEIISHRARGIASALRSYDIQIPDLRRQIQIYTSQIQRSLEMVLQRIVSLRAVPVLVLLSLLCLPANSSMGLASDRANSWKGRMDPISAADWNREFAAHLLERAGFGGTPADVDQLVELGPRAAVRRLVSFEEVEQSLPPFVHSGIWKPGMDPFPASRAEAVRQAYESGESMGVRVDPENERPLQPIVDRFFYLLRADVLEARRASNWWAERMLQTQRPLQERMALFWHGHFATSDAKVRDYRKLLLQLDLFHREGLGNFRNLLLGITRDPAMLVYLDNGENLKGHPNENFGREVLEMFTMGVGNYTETDIRETSRAFTGWTQEKLEFKVRADQHDDGVKTVLGKTGPFDGEQVIDIILAQSATPRFLVSKIYRTFVGDDPSAETIEALAKVLIENSYEIAPVMETIFLAKDFYSSEARGSKIKSPVQLLVSTYRKLGLEDLPTIPDFNRTTASLGQLLLHPPNVAGWSGGTSWITGASLLQRADVARDVLFPDVEGFRPPDRQLPGIYRQVAARLKQGMDITQATSSGSSSFSQLASKSEDYNTRYAGYIGYEMAWEVVKLIPRAPAQVELAEMLNASDVRTAKGAVDSLIERFLSVPIGSAEREELVRFASSAGLDKAEPWNAQDEQALRELLHLILSLPEYQLA